MTSLYRHPRTRYALFWPFIPLGQDYVRAAAFGGVGAGSVVKNAMPMFAVRVDERENMRLPARTHRDALACVAHLAARGATRIELYQGARMRADGRTLWAATDTFSREPSLEILAPTGLVIKAKLDPLRAGDFRHITSLAAGDLASTDREVGLPAVTRFVDRVSNVDPEKGMGAFDDKLKAAAAKLRADQGKLDRAWVKTADKHFTKITEDTRASVKNRFMGGLAVDLSQPQVAAVERFVEQQGWFVRGMDGQRNTALTERARKIVANGLAQGFGRAQIADDMRKQLPDMWQGMGKSYAHVVAANGLARARAHAELSSYQDGGIQYAEVVAMLDERTSDICVLYGMMITTPRGPCEVSTVRPGDSVITGMGLVRNVRATSKRDADAVYHLRLSSGHLLSLTGNHPVLAADGWKRADAIQKGDKLASQGSQKAGRLDDLRVPALPEDVRGAEDLRRTRTDVLLLGAVSARGAAQGLHARGADRDVRDVRAGVPLSPVVGVVGQATAALLEGVQTASRPDDLRGLRCDRREDVVAGVDGAQTFLLNSMPGEESCDDRCRAMGIGRATSCGDGLPARGEDRQVLGRHSGSEVEACHRGGRGILARPHDGEEFGTSGIAGAQGGGDSSGGHDPIEDRWRKAKELSQGEQGQSGAGEVHPRLYLGCCARDTVESVTVEHGTFTVYNLEVDDDPTYVAEGVVVHNCRLMDGQIIPIKGALGLANQAASVTTPEDVGQVTPFLRERRNDKGALEIRAGSKVLGSFDREGSGRVDDRGRAQQYTAGAGFIDAKVGAPPYHHNCRTTLLPRMDIAQVPKGQAVRATGPAPAGAGDVLSFGALEQFKMPTARAPVTTGTLAPIDDYGIPAWKAPPKAIQAAVTSDQQALGLRVMGAQAATRGFDTSAPWARVSQQEAATARATLATANDAMVQVLHTGSPRQVAGAMLANPASIGREQIIQLRDAKGREVWARFTGRSSKALNEAADAVRLATTPAEATLASEKLFNAAVREGAVRIGDSLEAVSAPKGSRVTTGTSGLPARNPRNGGGARATAEQPQRGTKRGVGASPITEEPATPYKGDLRKTYAGAGATVFSARPDGAVIARETWAQGRGVWSSAAVDINGNALNRSAWESLSATHGNTTQAALSVVRPRPSDRVVNVVGTRVVDLALAQTRRYIVSALEAERAIKHGVDRDWIISDHDGGALFLRVDGSTLASLRKDVFAKAANAWVRSGSDTDLRKLGGTLEDTLGRFYLSARVDWQQRNLIVGVPLAEQVDRRVATVRDEIQMAIRSQEATKGRGMTAAEKGALVQRMVRDGSAMAKPSAVLPDRTERMGPDELRGAMALDQERAGIKGTVALQRGAIYRRAVDFAFAPCSDALLQAVSAMGSPRIYYAPGAPRTLAIAHDTLLGDGGSGVVVIVPRDVDKLLRGSTPAAREDRSALRHAAAHLYGLAGQTDVAARIARNRGARDISSVRAGDLDVFGKGGGLAAMALPGAWVSPYDARVYGQDAARIRKLIGNPFEARVINDPEDVNAWATRTGQEFLSTAVERLEDAVAIGTNWEIAPDQVAFMISALRGHYVPH